MSLYSCQNRRQSLVCHPEEAVFIATTHTGDWISSQNHSLESPQQSEQNKIRFYIFVNSKPKGGADIRVWPLSQFSNFPDFQHLIGYASNMNGIESSGLRNRCHRKLVAGKIGHSF